MPQDFELISHTADMQIRVYGKTLNELFINALNGMFQSIKPRTKDCRYEGERLVCDQLPIKRDVYVTASDRESLLVDFLSEALSLSDIHDEAYLDATIDKLTDKEIKATLHGIKVQGFEVVEIKAVTYHNLKIQQIEGVWQTDIVFDI